VTRAIAAIFAHPDDEVFSIGGTIAKYARAGVRCDLYCATDGDAGRASGVAVRSRGELARRRRAELEEGARMLGISDIRFGGHPDGALAAVDADALIGEIVEHLRRWRPQIVITFGPEGAPNAHRDHRAISRAATAAFFAARIPTLYPEQVAGGLNAHAVSRLFYVAWPVPQVGAELPVQSLPVTARIDIREFREVKRASFLVHATQQDHLARFEELGLTATEDYHLAAGTAQGAPVIADLFEGLPTAPARDRSPTRGRDPSG
jgi:LmbE family N-acetylglucosaminyl deacetylase